MAQEAVRFASPRIAEDLMKAFGKRPAALPVTMRQNRDVPNFIKKVEGAHRRAAKSTLRFGPSVPKA